eukprot:6293720-Amphidinium_carterae.4
MGMMRWLNFCIGHDSSAKGRQCKEHVALRIQGTAQHGPLEPDLVWLTWRDFAMKVYHFWRLVGPQLRERPKEQPSPWANNVPFGNLRTGTTEFG